MADFIARVELHNANYTDYENLHTYMANRGFARTIVGSDGNTYQLPTGTYVARDVNATVNDALSAAVAAANDTGRTSSIIVTDWTTSKWQGLPIVRR